MTGQRRQNKDMAFFRSILSNKRVDIDMEAGHHSDVELDYIEAGSGSAHSIDPAFQFSFQNSAPNAAFPLFPPAQVTSSTSLNTDRRRSHNDDRNSKVRVVEQGSKISTIVCVHFP